MTQQSQAPRQVGGGKEGSAECALAVWGLCQLQACWFQVWVWDWVVLVRIGAAFQWFCIDLFYVLGLVKDAALSFLTIHLITSSTLFPEAVTLYHGQSCWLHLPLRTTVEFSVHVSPSWALRAIRLGINLLRGPGLLQILNKELLDWVKEKLLLSNRPQPRWLVKLKLSPLCDAACVMGGFRCQAEV